MAIIDRAFLAKAVRSFRVLIKAGHTRPVASLMESMLAASVSILPNILMLLLYLFAFGSLPEPSAVMPSDTPGYAKIVCTPVDMTSAETLIEVLVIFNAFLALWSSVALVISLRLHTTKSEIKLILFCVSIVTPSHGLHLAASSQCAIRAA